MTVVDAPTPVRGKTENDGPHIAHFFPALGAKSLCGVPYDAVPDRVDGPVEKCVVCVSLRGEA